MTRTSPLADITPPPKLKSLLAAHTPLNQSRVNPKLEKTKSKAHQPQQIRAEKQGGIGEREYTTTLTTRAAAEGGLISLPWSGNV